MTSWRVAPLPAEAAALRPSGTSPVLSALLWRRGIRTAAEAAEYLAPDPSRLHDPFAMKGMAEAVDVLVRASSAGRRIVVFGDYDVDGVTAVVQLRAALRRAGADAVAFLPHRLRDGYGLKPETVRRVLERDRPAVIVTVDCGVTALEGVACARAAGVEVVVTDHHLAGSQLPDGAVVVNPHQPGCTYPYKELAACGIAFKLALAVAARAGFTLSLESLLRVACLGTIADLVPLTGENRVIAASGLAALAAARSPGLRALLAESGISPAAAPESEDVAFRVAPRLNAAGRLDTAELALSLFEERHAGRGAGIARELSRRNAERQSIERRVVAEARARIEKAGGPGDTVIVEADPAWHRGVLGIAASRLAREYHRPTLLFGFHGDRAVGSGRSIPGVPLHDTLQALAPFFDEFGGHDQAVGGALPADRFEAFRDAARAHFAARLRPENLERVEESDLDLPLEDVSEELLAEISALAPHGMGNPRPVFHCAETEFETEPSPLGEHGLRGLLRRRGPSLPCLSWSPDSVGSLARPGRRLAILYRLQRRRAGGVEAEIVAARPAGQSLAAEESPALAGSARA
ncbi:MAG TPA: single-stranded-DNA-specific exonuclease RecJ [Thermoanaerobaculia bacterium]|nr:single-stranded-DNA-specific exonuclease RecJ [Thermoanaerobaculia bacterium]